MRAKEFITEEHEQKVISFDKMDNYEYYRFGMDMATGEDLERDDDAYSSYIAYTAEDEAKINAAAKKNGQSIKQKTNINQEPNDTNNVSPVAKKKKNKYGI